MSLLNIRTALTMVKDILKTLHFLYKLYFFPLLEEACGKNQIYYINACSRV